MLCLISKALVEWMAQYCFWEQGWMRVGLSYNGKKSGSPAKEMFDEARNCTLWFHFGKQHVLQVWLIQCFIILITFWLLSLEYVFFVCLFPKKQDSLFFILFPSSRHDAAAVNCGVFSLAFQHSSRHAACWAPAKECKHWFFNHNRRISMGTTRLNDLNQRQLDHHVHLNQGWNIFKTSTLRASLFVWAF